MKENKNTSTSLSEAEKQALQEEFKDIVEEIKNRPKGSVKVEKSYMLDGDGDELLNYIEVPEQKEKE